MPSSILKDRQNAVSAQPQRDNHSPHYNLRWRQGRLLVGFSQDKQPYLPAIDSVQWLVECLKHSPVELVCIDPTLGEAALYQWADACEQAKKPLFLRGAFAKQFPREQSQLIGFIKRLINWITGFVLLLILSPVMLATVVLIQVYSPGAIFSVNWYVGTQGKLFRTLKFRTTEVNNNSCTTPLGRWLCQYSLDELPQLFNVLRGEMSLVGMSPLTLPEAVRFSQKVAGTTKCDRLDEFSASGFVAEA
jgi:Sugar transferases involved in lipopolysaccharide synthesis